MKSFFHVLLAAAVLAAIPVPSRAERTRYLPADRDMRVVVEYGKPTRLVMPGRIRKVVPATRELSLKIDGGTLYIVPMSPDVRRLLWIEAGRRTYAVRVVEGSPRDETAVVVDARTGSPADRLVSPPPRGAAPTVCILRDLAGGRSCPGAARRVVSRKLYKDGFLEITAVETLTLGYLTGVRATVRNLLSTSLRLDARRFEFAGAVAVALDDQWLPAGDSTSLYLVVDRRLQ